MGCFLNLALLLGLFLGGASTGWAARLVLFTPNGEQVSEYDSLIERLRMTSGNSIVIGEVEFKVKSYLGAGGTTAIFALDGPKVEVEPGVEVERAIRLPLYRGLRSRGQTYASYLKSFVDGMRTLSAAGVRTVRVFESESRLEPLPQYVIVERVREKFSLATFFDQLKRKPNGPPTPAEREKMLVALESFVERFWSFDAVADFGSGQVVWDGKEWVLLDTLNGHGQYDGKTTFSIVEYFAAEAPKDIADRMRRAIERRRMQMRCENPLLFERYD